MSHDALIRQAQGGDKQAFASLLELHYEHIFVFSYQWCGNRQDAEDITQLVCVKLAKSIMQFSFKSKFSTWLYRLVINCGKDYLRSQKKHQQPLHHSSLMVELGEQSSEQNAVPQQLYIRQVLNSLEELEEGFKEVVLLVYAQGLSHKEAADVLGIKEGTVSWRLHEVRKELKDKFTTMRFDDSGGIGGSK